MREGEPRPIGDIDRDPGGVRVEANKLAAEGLDLGNGRLECDMNISPVVAARAGAGISELMGTALASWVEGLYPDSVDLSIADGFSSYSHELCS